MSGMKVSARSLQLECERILHEAFLIPVLLYCSVTMVWRKKERSRIRAVQMNNLRGLLGIRRMDSVPNARIRELCGVTKAVDENRSMKLFIEGSAILREWEMIGLPKECVGRRLVGKPRKRWID